MSHDNSNQQIRIDPNEEITEEKKIILLNQWKDKVQNEVLEYDAQKDKIFQFYKKKREKFDKILSVQMKKIKKIEMSANSRKKVLAEIVKEIENLSKLPPS